MSVIAKRLADVTVGDIREVLHMLSTMPAVSDSMLLRDVFGIPADLEPEGESLDSQIQRLGDFILAEIPGEPGESEGAVDTAIRLLRNIVRRAEARPSSPVLPIPDPDAASADVPLAK